MRYRPMPDIQISVGEALPFTVFDRTGQPLLVKGHPVESDLMLARLYERGLVEDGGPGARTDTRESEIAQRTRYAARPSARLRDAEDELTLLHRDLQAGVYRDTRNRIVELARDLQDAWENDPDQAMGLLQLEAIDHRLSRRLMHAALLTQVLSVPRGLDESRRLALMCAALTYDVALAQISETLANQAVPLSEAQWRSIQTHTSDGMEMLRRAGVDDEVWLTAVLDHHERVDGTGYPRGLRGEDVSIEARILGIVDIYTAMIRPRAYRDAQPSRVALRDIFLERGQRIDEGLATLFIKELGVYPPGTMVKLTSGEIAVAVRRTAEGAHPQLRSVIGKDGAPLAYPQVRDSRMPETAIVEIVPVSQYRSALGSLNVLWARGATAG
ncbi:HD domain-containing phosphohydrolase [Silanimonas sp.]|uniref:HD-GYP domain-containing protein n=1 Tax=Silanimonas sp. TaxID=1929290 RepID=UPI0022BE7802|nr:HD domain-containing phosphohydrolase [Silanimonas sp.]MCZ8165546.1 HD domain-containing protein [Silanimonas sp.]